MKYCSTAKEAKVVYKMMMARPPSKRRGLYFRDDKNGELEKFNNWLCKQK